MKAGLLYGLLGFAAGFIFGTLREVVLIPLFGLSLGHWLEFIPLVAVIIWIGIWITNKWALVEYGEALRAGILGVAVLLVFESILAIFIFGLSIAQYLASFNVLDGELFPIGLLIMAAVPAARVFLTANKF